MTSASRALVIVGGGIVGLAIALAVTRRYPALRVTVVEKEPRLATHQTGHNSGVIHSGIYYRPGSLKATLCVRGAKALQAFCASHQIPYHRCGKVVVAVTPGEVPRLAVVDYGRVVAAMARDVEARGGIIRISTRVTGLSIRSQEVIVQTTGGDLAASALITCGGLHADHLARMARAAVSLHIVPFRGEYYELVPAKQSLVRGLVYPVPDPQLPFLGVHLTRLSDGRVEAGPNAVLGLAREGYRRTAISIRDTAAMAGFPGFWRMAARHWRYGVEEAWCAAAKSAFVRKIQRLVPAIHGDDLVPAPAGVRAQAVDSHGMLLDDFHILRQPRALHVCNAPSPAATASLEIGEMVTDVFQRRIGP